VCIQHIQFFAYGRYLVDFYVQVEMGRWYDMHLGVVVLGQQRVGLHDPNKM
jgi:hypothetical protein